MRSDNDAPGYCIWSVDNVIYGPVDLPTLVNWVQEDWVRADTWIFIQEHDNWLKADQIEELKMFFQPRPVARPPSLTLSAPDGTSIKIKLGSLRRVRILAGLSDQQLERFAGMMELHPARQWAEVVKQGSPGDAMYLVLEGEVRVRMIIAGKEDRKSVV